MPDIDTGVTGDVREYHFKCDHGHEFSVMLKPELEVEVNMPCVVLDCYESTVLLGDNAAEISKNAADLLEN